MTSEIVHIFIYLLAKCIYLKSYLFLLFVFLVGCHFLINLFGVLIIHLLLFVLHILSQTVVIC